MANETKNKERRKPKLVALFLSSICLFTTSCTDDEIEQNINLVFDTLQEVLSETDSTSDSYSSSNKDLVQSEVNIVNGEMTVHFIDVGQADSTLFVQNGQTMLFDAATKNRGDELVEYIQSLGINYIDVLVLSHPHDDHMGGSSEILNKIEVGTIYGPDIFNITSLDTIGWYNNMLDEIDRIDEERNKDIPENEQVSIWKFPRDENGEFETFNIGDAIVEFYAPLEDEYSDINDYSICAKVSYGEIDVMLTGDATTSVEETLLEQRYDLDVEIFQAGHHGSDTSNSREFLERMTPECVVISCGKENRYNHPIKSVVDLYKEMKIPVYRTDESGTIIMTTDGTKYFFNTEPGTYKSGNEYKGG